MNNNNENSKEAHSEALNIADVMRRNYDLLLSEMGGDEEKTRVALKYLNWLINDIEIFKNVDLDEYKEIWSKAFEYSCA